MHRRAIRRATAAALMLVVAATATTFAESVTADADVVLAGDQGTRDLGTARPGEDVLVDVTFRLDCSGTSHVDAGQLVRLTPGPRTVPFGGSFHVGTVLLIPSVGWPADGQDCPAGLTPVSVVHQITLTAPPTEGTDLRYVFSWTRSLVQPTTGDVGVLEGTNPSVTFILDVADNTPPALVLPADSTVEGDTTGGAVAAYDVSATDAEDAAAPTPICVPAVGDLLPLGTTTVACSATDSGGLQASGSFEITVVDTTAPVLAGMPADRSVTTADPTGATVTFPTPTASDVVDAGPAVQCAPASGSLFAVGSTTVTCTARDASGNRSSNSFDVDVTYVRPTAWSATWGEPVGSDGALFVANRGRTVPVKVELFADGVERSAGEAWLDVAACGGAVALRVPLDWDGARWTGHLDTGPLTGACQVVTASIDGHVAGSFRMELRGEAIAAKKH